MSEQEKHVCRVCDEDMTEQYETHDYCDSDFTGELLCESCYCSDLDHQSTLLMFQPDGESWEFRFGDHTGVHGGIGDCYDYGVPKWLEHAWPKVWEGRNYVSTGGYRGYYCTDNLLKLANVGSGWSTGNWDDVRHKWDFNTFIEELMEGNIVPPKNIYILVEPTSNVFSVATTILCEVGELEQVRDWIDALAESDGLDVIGALR